MKKLLLIFLLLIAVIEVSAQWDWQLVDSIYAPLPSTVHLYQTITPTEGKPNKAFYVRLPLRDRHLIFSSQVGNGKRYTPLEYYAQHKQPLIVMNCTFFEFVHNSNLNVVMNDGKLLAYNVQTVPGKGKDSGQYFHMLGSAIGINKKRKADIAWLYVDSTLSFPKASQLPVNFWKDSISNPTSNDYLQRGNFSNWKMKTAVGGGPVLVQQGEIQIANNEERKFAGNAIRDKHPRTGIGYTANGDLILLVIEGRFPGKAEGATLEQMATMFKQIGCIEAMNLDGGGSSCLLINGKNTIQPSDKEGQRPVPAVFMVHQR
ncbi:MAG: phosphodiester glycosidase family protein [Chitinophagia bacterium]|jgi:hypothetical protein